MGSPSFSNSIISFISLSTGFSSLPSFFTVTNPCVPLFSTLHAFPSLSPFLYHLNTPSSLFPSPMIVQLIPFFSHSHQFLLKVSQAWLDSESKLFFFHYVSQVEEREREKDRESLKFSLGKKGTTITTI